MADTRPIGVFDSGVGGLTVLHECLVTLPHEDFIYFGDSSPERFPYGPKPRGTIRRRYVLPGTACTVRKRRITFRPLNRTTDTFPGRPAR